MVVFVANLLRILRLIYPQITIKSVDMEVLEEDP
jgi:hypothetical protein